MEYFLAETEKYGRILADVICDGESLGELLLNARLAVKYDGGKKETPTNWLKYYSHGETTENKKDKKIPFYKKIINNIVSNRIKKNK